MNPRGHRGIAAVLMLLALVLSAMALLPANAQAATNTVTGLVGVCGQPFPVSGATVTLVDANGLLPSLTTTTASDGVFSFTPQPSQYTLTVTAPGYYSGGISTPFRFDGTTTVSENLCLTKFPPPGKTSFVTTFHVEEALSPSTFIGGATVSVYNATRQAAGQSALIATAITNGTAGANQGNASIGLWSDTFVVQVNATGFGIYIQKMTLSAAGTVTIPMTVQFTVVGHARNPQGQFLSAGLTATLYNLVVPKSNSSKLISAVVSGSLYTFYAPAGTYRMVVAANGYTAFHTDLPLSGTPTTVSQDAVLSPSPQELYTTTVLFGRQDWNNITILRNWTLNPDSSVPGLSPAGFRDLREQINYTFGSGLGDGVVSANDILAFTAWLHANGPAFVTTDTFMLLNLKSYNSSATNFTVSVSPTLPIAGAKVWINTSTTYQVKSTAWITYGQPKYFLNLTLFPSTNTAVYHNETYVVQLPRAYEMESDTVVPAGSVLVFNYTRITLQPGVVAGTPVVRMILQKSLNGTARAQLTDPVGSFYVVNSTYQNYQAYLAENVTMTFSGAQSTDPVGDITKANFTWEFQANVNPSIKGWGITSKYKYTATGQFTVNVTVVQAGGNVTYRNVTIWVDGYKPIANFKTNYTGTGSAIGATLRINASTTVKFDASLSTDLAYPGKSGVILNPGFKWVFDNTSIPTSTGRNVSWTFAKAGWFVVKLNVTDAVGQTGLVNATMIVVVNDTEPPLPGFTILDPTNGYAPVTTMTEGRIYAFNASKTTDDYNTYMELNYSWTIPGPLLAANGTPLAGNSHAFNGWNITFGWSAWNLSYAVNLTVKDRGFGSGKPNSATKTFNESVQIDVKQHPDLFINLGTVKYSSTSPESGQSITITLNVSDKANRAAASQLWVSVSESGSSLIDKATVGNGWAFVDKNGNPISNSSIPSGGTSTIRITVTVAGQGNKTISVCVADAKEPYTWITSENCASQAINVLQPAWVTYAIVGAIVAVFLVVIGAMYYRRKVKAGEWQPRLRRSKEEGGKEKTRKEKEVKEEKKRL